MLYRLARMLVRQDQTSHGRMPGAGWTHGAWLATMRGGGQPRGSVSPLP